MENSKFIGYVGTYTKGESEGIYSFVLDTKEEKLTNIQVAAKVDNPTYVVLSKDNEFLYSVAKEGELGGIAAYRVQKETGELEELNRQLVEGAPPCHVSISQDKKTVLSANYHKGTAEASLTNSDGTINPAASVMKHEGSGPDERQEKPHTHYAGFTPNEKYVVAVDLGADKVFTYELTDGKLHPVNEFATRPGSGPRHIVFHPNGHFAYVMTEISSEIIVLQYNEAHGSFEELQVIPTIPADFTENNQGSAIHISSDGRFIYAGNRGHNSIAIFQVDDNTGKLELVEYVSTEGDWPRDFVLDPTENFVVASNQESSNLVLYKRDKETGKLTVLQSDVKVPNPVCVKFIVPNVN